jgi:tetratricopeptide (TPR) repeat protein
MFKEASHEFNKGNFKISEIYLYDVLIINPHYPNAWVRLSQIYLRFNRFNEALYSINRSLALDEQDPRLNEEGQLHIIKAEILMKSGKDEEAKNILENVLEINPDYKKAKNLLNQCIKKLKAEDKTESRKNISKKSVKKAAKKFSKGEKDE